MSISALENKVIAFIIFFIPFTAFHGLPFLGELKNDLSAHFFIVAIILFLMKSIAINKIIVPKSSSFYLLILLLGSIVLSSIFNLQDIISSLFKGKSGLYRLSVQTTLYIFYSILGTLMFYNYTLRNGVIPTFIKVRKIILYSFLLVGVVGLIEIPIAVYKKDLLKPLYDFLIFLTFKDPQLAEINVWRLNRISSITQEPPFLAMYLIFSGPWMLSYLLDKKDTFKKIIPSLLLMVLTFYSGSRTALALVILQILAFFYYGFRNKFSSNRLIKITIQFCLIIILGVAILFQPITQIAREKIDDFNLAKKSEHSISNKTRFGTQVAAFEVFKENPILGVGLGQQGYYITNHYPTWASLDNWEIKAFKNTKSSTWPPGFSMLTRLLCELGIIGTIIFFSSGLLLLFALRNLLLSASKEYYTVTLVVFTTLFGFTINLLQFDSFRLIGYWFTFGLAYSIIREHKS